MAEHRVAHYTTLLSLSSAQVEGATAFFTEEATSETALHGRERTAHEALKAAVKSNEAAAIQEAATTLGQLEGERTALHATAEAKFYATLTSDQKTKFTELEREHGMRGPGGPPPPPQ
jgi:Spy/CpxP family protein refolding chaperone